MTGEPEVISSSLRSVLTLLQGPTDHWREADFSGLKDRTLRLLSVYTIPFPDLCSADVDGDQNRVVRPAVIHV